MAHPPSPSNLPWVEKYRPKILSEVVGNSAVVDAFQRFAREKTIPNLILSGPPGVGKTTCVKCLAREMWGKRGKDYVLVMNASDDRGINVVREKIKQFAQMKLPEGESLVKIVILDEADSMTTPAQQSLRRVIENYSETTRFAFAVNDPSKLIEAIQSRCAVLYFSRLSDDEIRRRLIIVCKSEGINFDNKGLDALIFTADGDMRPALNNLQATYAGFQEITEKNVHSICDVPHPAMVARIVNYCMTSQLYAAYQLTTQLYEKGYAAVDLVTTMKRVIQNTDMDDSVKIPFLQDCAVAHMRVLDGLTGKLQLACLLGRLCRTADRGDDLPYNRY